MSRSGSFSLRMSDMLRNAVKPAGVAVAAGVAMTGMAALAPAAQLDEKTCQQLKQEITQLEALGARENFAKGAQWGKANLRQAQLDQVKSLIEMDETVAFRCPRPKPVAPAADPAAAAAKGKAPAKATAPGKAMAKVLPKPPQPAKAKVQQPADPAAPRPKAKPKAAAGGPADVNSQAGAPGQAQAKPRPKQPTQAQTVKPAAAAQ